jgi:hypothetical protein
MIETQKATVTLTLAWAVIEGTYEKWVHPGAKNLKHYRAIFRSNQGERRLTKTKFKTATKALEFAARFNLLCARRITNEI